MVARGDSPEFAGNSAMVALHQAHKLPIPILGPAYTESCSKRWTIEGRRVFGIIRSRSAGPPQTCASCSWSRSLRLVSWVPGFSCRHIGGVRTDRARGDDRLLTMHVYRLL